METCPYCSECLEDDPHEKHNVFCPNHYPLAECREDSLVSWQEGFDCTASETELEGDERLYNPVFKLGYRMSHPGSTFGL